MHLMTCLSSTVNFMYFTVLGLEGILNSNAVAADFAKKVVPSLSFIAPIMGEFTSFDNHLYNF